MHCWMKKQPLRLLLSLSGALLRRLQLISAFHSHVPNFVKACLTLPAHRCHIWLYMSVYLGISRLNVSTSAITLSTMLGSGLPVTLRSVSIITFLSIITIIDDRLTSDERTKCANPQILSASHDHLCHGS